MHASLIASLKSSHKVIGDCHILLIKLTLISNSWYDVLPMMSFTSMYGMYGNQSVLGVSQQGSWHKSNKHMWMKLDVCVFIVNYDKMMRGFIYTNVHSHISLAFLFRTVGVWKVFQEVFEEVSSYSRGGRRKCEGRGCCSQQRWHRDRGWVHRA